MKKIGIIGGIGPESTIEYYRGIIDTFRHSNKPLPEIIIYSADVNIVLDLASKNAWLELANYMIVKLEALKRAGADFAVISANTPHIVFDKISEKSPLPLISIVEVVYEKSKTLGIKKIGLIGTKFTMQSSFYSDVFIKGEIEIIVPNRYEQEYMHDKLMTEIEYGIFKDGTRDKLLAIIKRMKDENQIQGLILGCTEFPLILTQNAFDIPFINTTAIHIDSIVNYSQEI